MAAPTISRQTPKRVYLLDNVCIICNFSFIQSEIKPDGSVVVNKYLNLKHKLNQEKINTIEKVVGPLHMTVGEAKNAGVCKKCHAKVEKCIRLQSEVEEIKHWCKTSIQKSTATMLLPSPRRHAIEKRLLRSPSVGEQESKIQCVQFQVMPVSPLKLKTINIAQQFLPILPKPETSELPSLAMPAPKPVARRSLSAKFSTADAENRDPTLENEIQV